LIKLLQAGQNADELGARIRAHLAREAEPELAGIRIVRGPADLDPSVPRFVVAYLEHMWQQR
jgi:hypothetical protein